MIYYVYMLKSKSIKPITYVGYTNNVKNRLNLHNTSKGARFTKGRKWELIYYKKYSIKSNAMKGEYRLKKDYKLRNLIKANFLK